MPVREYQCFVCDNSRTERTERLEEKELPPLCPLCGIRMVWTPTQMTFMLKGPGWTPKGNQ